MKKRITDVLYTLGALEGLGAVLALVLDRSESRNALFAGLSAARLAMAAAALLLIAALFVMRRRCADGKLPGLLGWALLWGCGLTLLAAKLPQDDSSNPFSLLCSRGLPLLIWGVVLGAELLIIAKLNGGLPNAALLFCEGALIYGLIAAEYDKLNWGVRLDGHWGMIAGMILTALLWAAIRRIRPSRAADTWLGALFLGVLVYGVTRSTALWMGRVNTPSKAYWDELAEAFLHGQLWLDDPAGTHDLTLYNDRWYVPNPPLPAIVLMPYVALKGGAEAVNMVVYSAILAGVCASLVWLTLRSADRQGLFPVSVRTGIWVTLCMTLGTDLLWLGTTGQMWFISQLLTTAFTLLALICVIERVNPVLCGLCLGLGILARPNVFTVYLCLFGVWLWQQDEFPKVDFWKMVRWGLASGIPVLVCVFFLLYYNYVRFEDWMDFGYVTINGADWILESVTEYGMFHPHFLKTNISVMLFGLPRIDLSGERFFFYPYVAGYSIFLMTPALVYCFRNLKRNWWIVGAWASVLVTCALLLCYHNTGAEQVGFRYLLDAAAPLTLLIANGTKDKISPLFKGLTVFAILLAFVSIYWWYLGRA